MEETIDDFWRMIWEHHVTIIVMLTKLKEMGREKCAQYWPADRSTQYGHFVVEPTGQYHMPQYILNEFKVTDSRVCNGVEAFIFHHLFELDFFFLHLLGWSISNYSTFSLQRMA